MGRRWRGALVGAAAAALLVSACGSSGATHSGAVAPGATTSSTYPRGSADSPYWIAGWLPSGAHLSKAYAGSRQVAYESMRNAPGDPDDGSAPALQVSTRSVLPSADVAHHCGPPMLHAQLGRIRGHVSCEVPDSDEGNEYGWIISWDERPDLEIDVEVSSPQEVAAARVIARHVASDVRPVPARTWALLVEMTDISASAQGRPVVAERGRTHGHVFTLAALVPDGFPLGPDDIREPCAAITYAGQTTKPACPIENHDESRWDEIAGEKFAFGVLPAGVRTVELRGFDKLTGKATNSVIGRVATVGIAAVSDRFYVAPLPADACGVTVFDGATRRQIGEAFEIGYGAPCTPVFGAPPTTTAR